MRAPPPPPSVATAPAEPINMIYDHSPISIETTRSHNTSIHKLDRRTLKRIRASTNYIHGVQVFWPPAKTQRGEMTMDADGHRYRRCTQCHAWFSRKIKSKCPCNTATYCSHECQKENWRVHKLHCTAHNYTQQKPLSEEDHGHAGTVGQVIMAAENAKWR